MAVVIDLFCRLFVTTTLLAEALEFDDMDLPDHHINRFFSEHPELSESFRWQSQQSTYLLKPFWRSSNLSCPGDFNGWAESLTQAEELFFTQADFGYVRDRKQELTELCHSPASRPANKGSSLRCSNKLQFCEADNVMIDFSSLKDRIRTENLRYKMDILSVGDIKMHCDVDQKRFSHEQEYMSPLQSWAPELRNIKKSKEFITVDNSNCDEYIAEPVYMMKLDATVNMYHHFCDFLNLYMSMYLKKSDSTGPTFDRNNRVLIWENIPYQSNFRSTWDAFTKNPLMTLENVAGRRVCFKNAIFPLLPRMLFGLFYNTPLVPGCQDSALFTAFAEFITHRLRIPVKPPEVSYKLRVTMLSRQTKYRRVLNEYQLIKALEETGKYIVDLAAFDHGTPFKKQLEVIRNTDILIGMHGAGLTHLLFLPSWAGVFELYHCDDPACYSDLARLRGLKYRTWTDLAKLTGVDPPEGAYNGQAHQKFRNYRFNVDEFLRLVEELRGSIFKDQRYLQAVPQFMAESKQRPMKASLESSLQDSNEVSKKESDDGKEKVVLKPKENLENMDKMEGNSQTHDEF